MFAQLLPRQVDHFFITASHWPLNYGMSRDMSLSDLHGRHSPVRNNIPWTSETQELVLAGNNLMNSDIVLQGK